MPTISKHCGHCGLEFLVKDYRQKFCNRSCSASFNNSKFKKRVSGRTVFSCLNCSMGLTLHQSKFCSHSCAHEFRNKEKVSQWLNGKISATSTNGTLLDFARAYLLAECGGACTECGWSKPNPKTGKVILTIDHKDGNWLNNERANLVVLCYNCHTLTETFGSLNKNNTSVKYTRRNLEEMKKIGETVVI
jgi:hypothetical protein